ncbi:fucolectin-like [Elgaria multicarinata webbii]|uniref:fucolectin-like n=1 Tax=Elgaria multicarinata webbii TaxID=159646 RepID=UPI002FCCFEF7
MTPVSAPTPPSLLRAVSLVPNLARGRPAFQSSIYPSPKNPVAERAVDGNCGGDFYTSLCVHTKYDYCPWWYVDLGDQYDISAVVVKNREDCCGDRLKGAQIHVGDSVDANGQCSFLCGTITDNSLGSISTIHCNGRKGRYVSVSIPGRAEFLQICEVEVYGVKCPTPSSDSLPPYSFASAFSET